VQRRKDATMTKTTTQRGGIALAMAAAGALLGACTEKTPCDENQQLRDGYCWPVDAAVGPGDAEPVEAGPVSEAGAIFGAPCATVAECVAPTTYCTPPQGGAPLGFCTALGCDTQPDLCPSTWKCLDLEPEYHFAVHMCVPGSQ